MGVFGSVSKNLECLVDGDTIFVDNMHKKAKAIEIVKGTFC